jgi:signal transduction histidine kinase
MWLAPFHLQRRLIEKIDALGDAAAGGREARIVLKMNALTDDALMLALVRAGRQGVKIDLIVRGACMLPARVAGVTDNIRVRSIIGRFLEHSRVFYFRQDEQEELYLSSADWMNRNMLRRIELAWPVTDAKLRRRIVDECLVAMKPIVRRAVQMVRPAGGATHLGITVSPVRDEAGQPHGAICLFTDLSDVAELEEQLRLKDSLARLGELTAGIAHEFRNGLATIHGCCTSAAARKKTCISPAPTG